MRPRKLTLRGINSYRKEQVIDFSALTSSGLFGIFGPTGSGKSSILDAITLALYAKLPRSTKNFININEQTAAVSFQFSITTTETRIYQVERGFRYHKSNAGPTVRNTNASLADITGETPLILADRPTDVTQECTRILGLNSDDFMRTVVLPQGQFSDFLKLKNAERRGMLQRIFHLEQYGLELTQKIAAARQKHDLLLSSLEGQLQMFEAITPDTLKEIQQKQIIVQENTKKAAQDKQKAEAIFKEAEALRSLLAEYAPVKKKYEELCSQVPAMKEMEHRLQLGNQANQLQPFALESKRTASAYQEACLSLDKAKAELAVSSSNYEKLQQQKEQIFSEYETKLPLFLSEEQEYRNALERCDSITQWKTSRSNGTRKLAQQKKKQDALSIENDSLLAQDADLKNQIARQTEAAGHLRIPQERMAALEQGHVLEETYREKRQHYEENKQTGEELQKKHKAETRKLHSLSEKIMELQQSALTLFHQENSQMEEQEQHLKAVVAEKEQLFFSLEQLENHHHALALQASLKDGDICPVCGGIYSSAAASSENLAETEEQKKGRHIKSQIEKLEKEEERLTAEKVRLEQQIALINMTLQNMEHLISTEDFFTVFSSAPSKASTKRQANDTPVSLQRRFQKLSSDYVSSRERLTQLTVQHEKLSEQMSRQKETLQQSADTILELRNKWNAQNFTEDLSHARAAEKEYDAIQEKLEKLRKQLDANQLKKEAVTKKLSESAASISTLENEIQHFNSLIETEQRKFPRGLFPDSDFATLLKKVQENKKKLECQKKALDAKYQDASSELQEKREQLTAADSRQKICKTSKEQAAAVLQAQQEASDLAPDANLDSLYL
ncbi:MAG: SMC family ATPase, partial [Clostridiales bacterium]|nr:SMC family ATPase [Clostridiales bacterium]